jgi:hypothetical protein
MATVSPKQIPDPCGGRLYESRYGGIGVAPAVGSATVSWPNDGGSTVQTYRVAAVPQDLVVGTQPPLNWVNVAPGTGCGTVSTTVGGLSSGAHYIFWLNAVYQAPGDTYTRDRTFGMSSVVQIP